MQDSDKGDGCDLVVTGQAATCLERNADKHGLLTDARHHTESEVGQDILAASLYLLSLMLARAAKNVLPKPSKPPFSFRGCLNARQHARYTVHSRAATTSAIQPASVDDINLIDFFDQPYAPQKPTSLTGLFGHRSLTTPASFIALADSTLRRAQLLTERILRARESRDELFRVVKNLDRLSDMLCGVIDLAELLRNAHPDPVWVQSAEEVYEKLCEDMNILNTNVELYEVRTACIISFLDKLKGIVCRYCETFSLTRRS